MRSCRVDIGSVVELTSTVDQLEGLRCTWIDTGMRDFYRVGHLLQISFF